ncbi:MAG: ammonia-forming cytochrome c nitrite reductase subunit c552 [Coriobacteriia bacterium]
MRARRLIALVLVAIAAGAVLPANAAAATDAFGRVYAGQARCLECHDGLLASDRTAYSTTAHGDMVVDVRANPSRLVPLAASFWPSPGFGAGLRFDADNVFLLVGGGHEKDFVGVPGEPLAETSPVSTVPTPTGAPADDLAIFSGAAFNTETNVWVSTGPTTVRAYFQSCGSCHNTGVTRPSADTLTLANGATISPSTPTTATGLSIQCEVCHGTASSASMHDGDTPAVLAWTATSAAPGRLMSAEVCGQCHVDGTTVERNYAGTGKFSSPNGYSADETLTAYFTPSGTVPTLEQYLASPGTYKFYPNGANRSMRHPYYNEWLQNKASNGRGHIMPMNPPALANPACLRCHSGEGFLEYIGDPIVPGAYDVTGATTKWGITCQVCHNVHDPENGLSMRSSTNPAIDTVDCSDCHNWQFEILGQTVPTAEGFEAGQAALAVRHPQRELLAGMGLIGISEAGEFMPGAECADCHMPEMYSGRPSHRFKVMTPGDAAEWGVRAGGDSCTPCHPSTSRADLQASLDEWQAETAALLAQVTAAMPAARLRAGWTGTEAAFIATTSVDPDVVAYKKVYHNRSYVYGDATLGAHNPPYAQAGLEYALYMARTIGASVSLSGPEAGIFGTDITVVGSVLMGDGSAAPGERVELQARKVGEADFTTVALTDTNGLGAYSAAYRLTERTELRAVWICEGTERSSSVIAVEIGSSGGATPVDRVSGATRYATAVAASRSYFTAGSVANVVLASGVSFPDALSANALAGVAASPLLLTAPTALPSETLAEITRIAQDSGDVKTTVWIVGGERAVGPEVANQLVANGFAVKRLAGDSRYATSARVAAVVIEILGDSYSGDAFVVNGLSFPDGLSVGPIAYAAGMPVLLTEAAALPAPTAAALSDHGITWCAVVGGADAVSDRVITRLPVGSGRVAAGADRYSTAVSFAEWATDQRYASYGVVGVASGATFPDALAAGAPIGAGGGVLLLTRPTALPDGVGTLLTQNAATVGRVIVFGGTGAVNDTVRSRIYDCCNGR